LPARSATLARARAQTGELALFPETNGPHMPNPRLVVVTPVYEDRQASSQLFRDIHAEFGADAYVVAVEDGSVREPLEVASLAVAGLPGVILELKRNVGHQRAIAIGLGYAADHFPDAAATVVMDSDGEDLPASIKPLLAVLAREDVDIAVAERRSRVETLRFRAFYVVYKLIFGLLTGRRIAFGNFMALKPVALGRLSVMPELWTHVAGSVLSSKLRVGGCPLDRGARYAGRSKMNFVGLVLHGFKALMVFAEDVLVRIGLACVLISALAMVAAVIAVMLKVLGVATPGFLSTALGLLFLMVLQTGALTLITLMLSGVVKGGALATGMYREYIARIVPSPVALAGGVEGSPAAVPLAGSRHDAAAGAGRDA
jgi:hypothetical protein